MAKLYGLTAPIEQLGLVAQGKLDIHLWRSVREIQTDALGALIMIRATAPGAPVPEVVIDKCYQPYFYAGVMPREEAAERAIVLAVGIKAQL